MKNFLILFIFSFYSSIAFSFEFKKELEFNKNTYKLVGQDLLTYSWFRVRLYQLGYFKGKDDDSLELLALKYKRDISKDLSIKGWEVGIGDNIKNFKEVYEEQWKWLEENTKSVKEGDLIYLIKEGDQVSWFINEELNAKKMDKDLKKLIFMPWLGDKPVDKSVKKNLLGR